MPSPEEQRQPLADPVPSPRHSLLARFRRIMKWMALLSIVVAAIAVLLVASGDSGVHLHMMIATALGAGLTVLLASALMTLAFLSSSSGHDDQAKGSGNRDDQ
jgi:hypothetical protein